MIVKDPGSRLLRWRIKLEEYDYEIVYKPGVQNSNADALSRIGALAKESSDSDELDPDTKLKILRENHDSILVGHRGMKKSYEAIKRHYKWPNMGREIEEYVKTCEKCQLNKTLRPKKRAPMEIMTTARHPFEKCALDIVGSHDGNNVWEQAYSDVPGRFE